MITNFKFSNKMKRTLLIILFQSTIAVFAQQIPVNDQYFTNGYFLNPAKAGNENGTNTFLFNRQQWTGIQGAPQTSLFSIDGLTHKKKIGLGLLLSNDCDNIFNRTAAYGTYAYNLKITGNQKITMAASVGLMNVNINFNDIRGESTDLLLLSTDVNKTDFDANFGVNYSFKKLEVGLVAYQLAGTRFHYEEQTAGKVINYQLIQHFYGVINYSFTAIPEKLTVTPCVMVRSTLGITPQLDGSIFLKYKKKVWTNIGWRQNACVYTTVGGIIYDNVIIGGSYEYNIGSISKFSGSSFEVIVGYRFGKSINVPTAYSGVDQSDIDQLKNIAQKQSEKVDQLVSDNKKLSKTIQNNQKEIIQLKEEIDRLKKTSIISPSEQKDIEDFKKQHEVKSFSENQNTDSVTTSFNKDQYCVIVGAYKTIKNAKLGQKILKREIGLQTYLIKKPKSSFYFIATDFFDNLKDVNAEYKRLKSLNIEKLINGKAWVYKAE